MVRIKLAEFGIARRFRKIADSISARLGEDGIEYAAFVIMALTIVTIIVTNMPQP